MSDWYLGIDFANRALNVGRCYIEDDGNTLTAHVGPIDQHPKRIAVDCPFGTSEGFEAGLSGTSFPDTYQDGYKTRHTEQALRNEVTAFATNQDWRNRPPAAKQAYPRPSYFNGGAHIQSSVGLVIVPALLHWLAEQLAPAPAPAANRLAQIKDARLGVGPIVEAHPRLFLYSAVERVRQNIGLPIAYAQMDQIAGYKSSTVNMMSSYVFLAANSNAWTGNSMRNLAVSGGAGQITGSDHTFDAWLAALTAWAHDHNETWTWAAAGLAQASVEFEGHMLMLTTQLGAAPGGLKESVDD